MAENELGIISLKYLDGGKLVEHTYVKGPGAFRPHYKTNSATVKGALETAKFARKIRKKPFVIAEDGKPVTKG